MPPGDGGAAGNGNGGGAHGGKPLDDLVLPFQTVRANISGRVVRLGGSLDDILSRHDYPDPVGEALGQALALTAMLGTALKFDGRFILQTKSDGPLDMLVVNYESPGNLRAYANFDKERLAELVEAQKRDKPASGRGAQPVQPRLLGEGHLAMTVDPGGDMDRYQGIVALQSETLESAAGTYFRQSEQLPTFLRLAVARVYEPIEGDQGPDKERGGWKWRAGGLLLQRLADAGGHSSDQADLEGEAVPLHGEYDEDWRRTEMLAQTVEDHELIDPNLPAEHLLYRLFHEEGVRVSEPVPLAHVCRCSRERVENFLQQFAAQGQQFDDLTDDEGKIAVTCEFCTTTYKFSPDSLG